MSGGDRERVGRNPALLIIAGCFALSAVARVADADLAFAVPEEEVAQEIAEPAQAASPRLLEAVRERQAQLDERARRLDEKAMIIKAGEERLRAHMEKLQEAEKRLSRLMQVAETAAEQDVGMLVSAFQNMDGKKAAAIFESMDVSFAAGLIAQMGEASAAEILGALTPETAYAITVNIAGRNARAPTE